MRAAGVLQGAAGRNYAKGSTMTRLSRKVRETGLIAALAGTSLLAGCFCFPDSRISTKAPTIDWARAHTLASALFDVSQTAAISDQQLTAMYQADTNEVAVTSTTFAGDTSPSRYMFIKDHAAGTQTIYLSGTNSNALWSFNLDLVMIDDPDIGCRVHRGFSNAALTVLDDALPRLEIEYPITVTGYSLGGAMAALLSKYLTINGYQVVEVVTFGQPKLTDAAGIAAFADLPILRFVNRNDPVPHLPPNDFLPGEDFDHFGPEVILYDGPSYSYLIAGDRSFTGSTTGDLVTTLLQANFNDHGNIYVTRLAEKMQEAVQIPYVCRPPASEPANAGN
jgi:triacylglycerol lipase